MGNRAVITITGVGELADGVPHGREFADLRINLSDVRSELI